MKVKDLTVKDLADRLAGAGILLPTGPFVARLSTRVGELVEPIHLLYSEYDLVAEGGLVDFEVRVDPPPPWRRWFKPRFTFSIDGRKKFETFQRQTALAMMEWAINWCVFTRPHHYFILHSAVVEREGGAFLLPGPPGSGKSTLCAAMVHRGWRLLSDEVAVMRPGTSDLVPVPRPIGLKEESIDVIRRFAPQAVLGPLCPGTRKGTVAHVRAPLDSIVRAGESARPRAVVFPAFTAGAAATLEPASKAQTLLRLADDAFNFSLLGESAFDTLADLIDACGCYELHYGDLDEAIGVLNELHARAGGEGGNSDHGGNGGAQSDGNGGGAQGGDQPAKRHGRDVARSRP